MNYSDELKSIITDDITYEKYISIRNILEGDKLKELFDLFVEQKIGGLNSEQQEYVINLLKVAVVYNKDKEELMRYILSEKKITRDKLNKVTFGRIVDLLPKHIQENPAFLAVFEEIMNFNQQRVMGRSELFFLLFGTNSFTPNSRGHDKKGDVVVDGLHIEIKTNNGSIHGGKGNSFQSGQALTYNKKLLKLAESKGFDTSNAEVMYSRLSPGGTKKTEGGNWLWQFLLSLDLKERVSVLTDYLKNIYHLTDSESVALAKKAAPTIGDTEKLKSVFVPVIFDLYKKEEKFDVLMVVDLKTMTFATNLSGRECSPLVKFGTPNVGRGYSTQAVPDGAMGVSLDRKAIKKLTSDEQPSKVVV